MQQQFEISTPEPQQSLPLFPQPPQHAATGRSPLKAYCERLTDLPTIRKPKQQADEQHDAFLVGSVFPATATTTTVYLSVKGKEVWGLIWDPGAADGLLGTHTLLEYTH